MLVGLGVEHHDAPPAVGCRDTHEWVNVGELAATAVVGNVEVRYPGGDSARLPETTVIVARVQPSIQAYVAQTDSRGEFAMPQVPEGRWRVGHEATHRPLRFITELDW